MVVPVVVVVGAVREPPLRLWPGDPVRIRLGQGEPRRIAGSRVGWVDEQPPQRKPSAKPNTPGDSAPASTVATQGASPSCPSASPSLNNPNLILSQVIQPVHQVVNLPVCGFNLAFEDGLGLGRLGLLLVQVQHPLDQGTHLVVVFFFVSTIGFRNGQRFQLTDFYLRKGIGTLIVETSDEKGNKSTAKNTSEI